MRQPPRCLSSFVGLRRAYDFRAAANYDSLGLLQKNARNEWYVRLNRIVCLSVCSVFVQAISWNCVFLLFCDLVKPVAGVFYLLIIIILLDLFRCQSGSFCDSRYRVRLFRFHLEWSGV